MHKLPLPSRTLLAMGRDSFVANSDDRHRRLDEESMKEELVQLKNQLVLVRREGKEVRERLRVAEKESLKKDKLLQELLATAKSGNGVPGEALDQLREDVQALLQAKRKAQEVRQVLEEKEQKCLMLQQELRTTNVLEMEEDVTKAKAEAKTQASEWAKANSLGKETSCFTQSQQHQQAAKALVAKITEVESEISRMQQRLTTLQDERTRLEQAAGEHEKQAQRLVDKCSELAQQRLQCEEKLESLGDVPGAHERIRSQCSALENQVLSLRQQLAVFEQSHSGWDVQERVLASTASTFRPMRLAGEQHAHPDQEETFRSGWLVRRLHLMTRAGHIPGLLPPYCDEDTRVQLTAEKVVQALQRLGLLPTDPRSASFVQRLFSALNDGLPSSEAGGIASSIIDLVKSADQEPEPIAKSLEESHTLEPPAAAAPVGGVTFPEAVTAASCEASLPPPVGLPLPVQQPLAPPSIEVVPALVQEEAVRPTGTAAQHDSPAVPDASSQPPPAAALAIPEAVEAEEESYDADFDDPGEESDEG